MNELESQIKELSLTEALIALSKEPGWIVLTDHLTKVSDIILKQLTVEEDNTKIIRLQERYRAFHSITDTINSAASRREHLQQVIEDIIEDERIQREGI